ncbi:MAG TPA: amidohydrolase family protein [Bryobacteraceae bacterium]|jgi:predicted TIM-barrel fold metal-dependent hydrolase
MIFDMNAFIGNWPYWPVPAVTPGQVAEELRAWDITTAAICSTRSIFVNWEDGNQEVLRAMAEHPEQYVGFACLGTRELSHALNRDPLNLDQYLRRGFAGIRLYPQHHSYHPLYCRFVSHILEFAEAHDWPVLLPLRLIMNWGMPMLELPVISQLIERHPRNIWILSGINYLHELQLAIMLMRKFPTVHLETSCIMGFAGIEKLVEELGPDRIVFGSGAPLQHGGAGVRKICHAKISDAAREAIFCSNAERILRQPWTA